MAIYGNADDEEMLGLFTKLSELGSILIREMLRRAQSKSFTTASRSAAIF